MTDFLLKAFCLAIMVASIMMFLFPAETVSAVALDLPWSNVTVRAVAFLALLVSFAIFSGPSKFDVEEAPTTPGDSVQRLAFAIESSETGLLDGISRDDRKQILGHLKAGNKIAAIQSVREASSCGLREAQETVEQLEATMNGSGGGLPRKD